MLALPRHPPTAFGTRRSFGARRVLKFIVEKITGSSIIEIDLLLHRFSVSLISQRHYSKGDVVSPRQCRWCDDSAEAAVSMGNAIGPLLFQAPRTVSGSIFRLPAPCRCASVGRSVGSVSRLPSSLLPAAYGCSLADATECGAPGACVA